MKYANDDDDVDDEDVDEPAYLAGSPSSLRTPVPRRSSLPGCPSGLGQALWQLGPHPPMVNGQMLVPSDSGSATVTSGWTWWWPATPLVAPRTSGRR